MRLDVTEGGPLTSDSVGVLVFYLALCGVDSLTLPRTPAPFIPFTGMPDGT